MLTPKELEGLKGIATSDYRDGRSLVGTRVWTWSANPFASPRTFSGVMASLVKKGLAGSEEAGDESTVWITEAGFAALVDAAPEFAKEA